MSADRRRCRRYPVRAEQHISAIDVDGARHPARLIDVSAEGFRVAVAPDLPVQVGQEVLLQSTAGWHLARIVHCEHRDGELHLGTARVRDLTATSTRTTKRWKPEFTVSPPVVFGFALVGLIIGAVVILKNCPDLLRFDRPDRGETDDAQSNDAGAKRTQGAAQADSAAENSGGPSPEPGTVLPAGSRSLAFERSPPPASTDAAARRVNRPQTAPSGADPLYETSIAVESQAAGGAAPTNDGPARRERVQDSAGAASGVRIEPRRFPAVPSPPAPGDSPTAGPSTR